MHLGTAVLRALILETVLANKTICE